MATTMYKYKRNDTLPKISKQFNTDVKTLVTLNSWLLDPNDGHVCLVPSKITYNTIVDKSGFGNTSPIALKSPIKPNSIIMKIFNGGILSATYTDNGLGVIADYANLIEGESADTFALIDYKTGNITFSYNTHIILKNADKFTISYVMNVVKPYIVVPLIGNGNTSVEDYWSATESITGLSYRNMLEAVTETNKPRGSLYEGLDSNSMLSNFSSDLLSDTLTPATVNLFEELSEGFYQDRLYDEFGVEYSSTDINTLDGDVPIVAQLYQKALNSGSSNMSMTTYKSSTKHNDGKLYKYYSVGSPTTPGVLGKVRVVIDGVTLYMPCFPESVSDGAEARFATQNVIGRSEPYFIYSYTDARSIQFTFKMHREMIDTNSPKLKSVEEIVKNLEAAVYPKYDSTVAPARVSVYIGNTLTISGIMTSEHTSWSGPIGEDDKYNIVDVTFTISEATGEPKSFNYVKSHGGVR